MNVRFRIGKEYKFTTNNRGFYISDAVMTYEGYDKSLKCYLFSVRGRYPQGCPKSWIEQGRVSVKTEWDKR